MAHSTLVRRSGDFTLTPTMTKLLITLLVLVLLAFLSVIALVLLRRARSSRKSELPMYNEHDPNVRASHHHRSLTLTKAPPYPGDNRGSIYVYDEKKYPMTEARSPDSPVPEIRITFPEEVDDKGSKQPGRVVVVRVGEHGVGLEPVQDEQLPPYQKDHHDRFVSLDLDRIGGLKEKPIQKSEYSI